jgi:aldehyde dehydrogenase (NAD+)
LHELSFGGGVVNDAVVHLANSNLPFGGVGNSGMGAYHGKFGFDTFTHYKPVMEKSTLLEPSVKYPPYSGWKRKLIQWLLE